MSELSRTEQFYVSLDELLDMDGIEGLNDHLDEVIAEQGLKHFSTDIAYVVSGVNTYGEILIEATYIPSDIN